MLTSGEALPWLEQDSDAAFSLSSPANATSQEEASYVCDACGAIHYVRPDTSTLQDRKVYTPAQLKAAGLRRTDPKAYRDQLRAGYIHGVEEDRPAVISINMQMASTTVNELLARVHPYRYDDNSESAIVRTSFIQAAEYREREPAASGMFAAHIGKGDIRPLLSMPELSEPEDAD